MRITHRLSGSVLAENPRLLAGLEGVRIMVYKHINTDCAFRIDRFLWAKGELVLRFFRPAWPLRTPIKGPQVEYQKDVELSRRINQFLVQAFGLPKEDYYARLSITNFLALKAALSDINNAVTMRLTLCFVDWAARVFPMDALATNKLRAAVLQSKPSSNGYDLYCDGPTPFIAEVKCNVPINGSERYGSAQRTGILNDIDALLTGKSKAASVTRTALKFMVFLDLPEVRAANLHFLKSGAASSRPLHFLASEERPSDPSAVYIVHMPLDIFHGPSQGRQVIGEHIAGQSASLKEIRIEAPTAPPMQSQQTSEWRDVALPPKQSRTIKHGRHQKLEPRLSKVDFQVAIRKMFADAVDAGQAHLDVHAGKLHVKVGGYPSPGHSMPSCYDVMYAEMNQGDEVLEAPPKKRGANVVIRYRLPRTN